ncbi:MAG: DUF3080 family protein [Halioglobus sp.]|nr:DUF3080 family protein [Halioglobus sp.]
MGLWADIKHTSGQFQWLHCCVTVTMLLGCQPQAAEAPFSNYLSRLSLALSVATPDTPPAAPLLPSTLADIRLSIPTSALDSLDFLSVRGCAVLTNIRKRSTGLSRQAKPSQRLLMTLEFLRLAPTCIRQLHNENNTTLADRLQSFTVEQRGQLPALIFNATLGSEEYRAFWLPKSAPGAYPRAHHSDSLAALHAINHHADHWLRGDYRTPERGFELLLGDVAGGEGGVILQALSEQGDHLADADLLVQRHIRLESRCRIHASFNASRDLTMRILEIFNANVAPFTVWMSERHKALAAPILDLESQLATILPSVYRQWIILRKSRAARGMSAPKKHMSQLMRLTDGCAIE